MYKIGTMQGRLLPMVDGRIQAFPGDDWEREFDLAAGIGYDTIELTIEMASYDWHPVRDDAGRRSIESRVRETGVGLAGLCCDVFMERPMASADAAVRDQARDMLTTLVRDCGDLGLPMIEIPAMGENSLRDPAARSLFVQVLEAGLREAEDACIDLIIESDLPPRELCAFIADIDHPRLGINYDTGNSTWFGFRPEDELPVYHQYVRNVHIKDCTVADYSVPLGQGETDFAAVFGQLRDQGYEGDFVLQAARQDDDEQAGRDYLAFTRTLVGTWLQ